MIGLGSNRLTVCRRGGMSVTQAGRGGMEWLAGYRDPIWASPYSAQATAALKAQFPTQWPTIRDYGWEHPEIVGYMNAYAPEDAKIAYSLVEGIGTRWLRSDAVAYIQLGSGTASSTGCYFKANFYIFTWGSSYCGLAGMNGSPQIGYQSGGWTTGANSSNRPYAPVIGGTYVYEWNKSGNGDYIIDGQDTGLRRTGTFTPYIFFCESVPKYAQMSHVWYKSSSTADEMHLVPFKRNGELGMIDLPTGTFYKNANTSGSFEEIISETPS